MFKQGYKDHDREYISRYKPIKNRLKGVFKQRLRIMIASTYHDINLSNIRLEEFKDHDREYIL